METDVLGQGLELLLAGMGTVFVFLTLLVFATSLMSRLVLRWQPPPKVADASDEEVAAIGAAIARYRGNK